MSAFDPKRTFIGLWCRPPHHSQVCSRGLDHQPVSGRRRHVAGGVRSTLEFERIGEQGPKHICVQAGVSDALVGYVQTNPNGKRITC